MTNFHGGVDRTLLETSVYEGLRPYQELAAEGGFRLLVPGVDNLQFSRSGGLTSGGLLSSETTVLSHSNATGLRLDVIVLPPNEGTGRYGRFSKSDIDHGLYPETYKVIPPTRPSGTIGAALAIASFGKEGRVLYANRLEAIGLIGHTAVQQAELGLSGPDFHLAMLGRTAVQPRAEYTMLGTKDQRPKIGPWAIFNNTTATQIFGLLHTTGGGTRPREIFDLIGARVPRTLVS